MPSIWGCGHLMPAELTCLPSLAAALRDRAARRTSPRTPRAAQGSHAPRLRDLLSLSLAGPDQAPASSWALLGPFFRDVSSPGVLPGGLCGDIGGH